MTIISNLVLSKIPV